MNLVEIDAFTASPCSSIRRKMGPMHFSIRRNNVDNDPPLRNLRKAVFPLCERKRTKRQDRSSDSVIPSQWKSLFQRLNLKFSKRIALGLALVLLLPFKASASSAVSETLAPLVKEVPVPSLANPISAAAEFQLSLRLVYAALLGAALGKERSIAKHSAGIRTMALVAMGASAFTVCSAYGFASGGRHDPSRMASNVASGVGFVGAGVITTTHFSGRNIVHGLTTAATIWLSAAVGVACGTGLHQIAAMAAALTIFILRLGRIRPQQKDDSSRTSSGGQSENQEDRKKMNVDHDEDDDEDDDAYAETHDTSDWDEIPPIVQYFITDERSKRLETQDPNDENYVADMRSERVSPGTKVITLQKDLKMEKIVLNARNNSTSPQMHIDNMERFMNTPINETVYSQ
eukprot:scaffold991_cov128-Cylindrotheca_fusiformis.AAC.7